MTPDKPELPAPGEATVSQEAARLARLDVYAHGLWFFAWRLANWDCGGGLSAVLAPVEDLQGGPEDG